MERGVGGISMKMCRFFLAFLLVAAAALAMPAQAYVGQGADGDTLGYWRLNNESGATAVDSSGRSNDGALYNFDGTYWVTGKFGYGLDFDGTGEYVQTGTSNFSMQQGTYEAWVNFDNWANSQNDVLIAVPSEAAATSANLTGYWRQLDDSGGITIEDISGNGNNGTIYGTGGTAESGTTNTLTDINRTWTEDEWIGETIYITEEVGEGQNRTVASNNDTTITVTSDWTTNPDHTSEYAVTSDNEWGTGSGRFGDAITFNGADNFILVPNSLSLCPTVGITLEAWVYPIEYGTTKVVEKGDWDGHSIGLDNWRGWKGGICIANGTSYDVNWSEKRPTLNKWYHLCLTYNGSMVRLFVNGVEKGNKTVPSGSSLKVNSRDLSIGSVAGMDKFFNGTIDEVRFYDAAISEDRIRSLYLGALSAHKNADNKLVMHLGPATMTTDVSGLSGWHHIAGTYDNVPGKAYLFLDGAQKAEADFSGGTHRIFGDQTYIGNDENNQMDFAGTVDEVRVLNYSKTGFSGGVVVNEVCYTSSEGVEWIELYNHGSGTVDCENWLFEDSDSGHSYEVPAGSNYEIASGNFAVIYLNVSANADSSGAWYTANGVGVHNTLDNGDLGGNDSIAVYDLDPDNDDDNENSKGMACMVDFVAWGGSPGAADANATGAGIWTDNTFVTSSGYNSIYLSADGNNDEAVDDWSARDDGTPAAPVPDVSALVLFASGLVVLATVCFVYGKRM